jgi:hypothetical protein
VHIYLVASAVDEMMLTTMGTTPTAINAGKIHSPNGSMRETESFSVRS